MFSAASNAGLSGAVALTADGCYWNCCLQWTLCRVALRSKHRSLTSATAHEAGAYAEHDGKLAPEEVRVERLRASGFREPALIAAGSTSRTHAARSGHEAAGHHDG